MSKCLGYLLSARNFERPISPVACIAVWHLLSFLLVRHPRSDGAGCPSSTGVDWNQRTTDHQVYFRIAASIGSKATVRKKPLGLSAPVLREHEGALAGSRTPSTREGGRIRGANSFPEPTSRKQTARNLLAPIPFPGRNAHPNRLAAGCAKKQSQTEKSQGGSGVALVHELRFRQ